MFDGVRRIKMKTKIISLMLVLSCAGASAATALPNSSGDLRALEENRADGDKTAVLTKEETNTDERQQKVLSAEFCLYQ